MKVSNKIKSSFVLLSLVFFISCNTVPIAQVTECVMPNDSNTSLSNRTTSLEDKIEDENFDLGKDDSDIEKIKICEIPEQVDTSESGGHILDINATLIDFSAEQKEKMMNALDRLKLVVNSVDFKERVLAHTYAGSKQFVDNDGLTNEEIYLKIMEGAENLSRNGDGGNVADGEIDLDIELYYSRKNVVGYTYPNVLQIWVNTKYFNTNSLGAVAANVIHEWTHKLGFNHSFYNNSSRPYSVPYGIGSIVKELINTM